MAADGSAPDPPTVVVPRPELDTIRKETAEHGQMEGETGGVLLGPIGGRRQTLIRATKQPDGSLDRESHGGVRFVPLQ